MAYDQAYAVALRRIRELEAQLAEAKLGWDSCIADLREAGRICKEAEDRLAALQWTPISPDNLPRLGDEVLRLGPKRARNTYPFVEIVAHNWTPAHTNYSFAEYRRPINAPLAALAQASLLERKTK